MLQLTAFTAENLSSFLSIFFLVFSIVCWYRIFEKCGEKGWYAIIPIYSEYVIYKLFLSKKLFFIKLLISIINFIAIFFTVFQSVISAINMYGSLDNIGTQQIVELGRDVMMQYPFIAFIILFCLIIITIIDLIAKYHILKGFDKGTLWFILYLFAETIVDAYLAFSNAEYIGNVYRKNKKVEVEVDTDTSEFNE